MPKKNKKAMLEITSEIERTKDHTELNTIKEEIKTNKESISRIENRLADIDKKIEVILNPFKGKDSTELFRNIDFKNVRNPRFLSMLKNTLRPLGRGVFDTL